MTVFMIIVNVLFFIYSRYRNYLEESTKCFYAQLVI